VCALVPQLEVQEALCELWNQFRAEPRDLMAGFMRGGKKVASSLSLLKGWIGEGAPGLNIARVQGRETKNKNMVMSWLKESMQTEALSRRAGYFSSNTSKANLLRNWIWGTPSREFGASASTAATRASRASNMSSNSIAYSWLVTEGMSRMGPRMGAQGFGSRRGVGRPTLAYNWLVENGIQRYVKRTAQVALTFSAALFLTASASPAIKSSIVRRGSKSIKMV
jgi:hypothetical protein